MREAMERVLGVTPTGIWSAPGRVNLIGEHTDYNGGLALPFAIDRRTRVAVRLRDDRRIRIATDLVPGMIESDLDHLGSPKGWSAYVLGVVWAIAQEHDLAGAHGFDAFLTSDVPIGVGVSSSASVEAAVCVALNELWGLGLERTDMVRLCQRAENDVVGAPTGTLDQSAVLFAQPDAAVLLDFTANSATPVPLGFDGAGLTVLLIDSTIRHDHATGGYGERRRECEEAARIAGVTTLREIAVADVDSWRSRMPENVWKRMRHIVTDTDRAARVAELVSAGQPADIGTILTEGHVSQRDDFEDSVPAIDVAVDAAIEAGALGARLTGGGFGGASIALVPNDLVPKVTAHVTLAVAAAGHPTPKIMAVRASDAAHRDEEAA